MAIHGYSSDQKRKLGSKWFYLFSCLIFRKKFVKLPFQQNYLSGTSEVDMKEAAKRCSEVNLKIPSQLADNQNTLKIRKKRVLIRSPLFNTSV